MILRNVSRETPSLHTNLVLLQLYKTTQKGSYILVWSLDFCNYCPKNNHKSGVGASRDYDCSPTG